MKMLLNLLASVVILSLLYTVLPGDTIRVSIASDGMEGNNHSYAPSISSDGRYVAFHSFASNLVSGDTNGTADIFVHDRATGATTRVSVDSFGTQGNNESIDPSISSDGRYVAFKGFASNLVSGDTNSTNDVFVHDRTTGATTRVSVATDGTEGNKDSYNPSLSPDGRYVAFSSYATTLVSGDTNNAVDIFVHDRTTGETTRVSVDSLGVQGNNNSFAPSISSDGVYVAFESYANNLVIGDTNGTKDVFAHDRTTNTTTIVSVDSLGGQGNSLSDTPSISSDGNYVAFHSYANNLVSGDTNGKRDIFVYDRTTGATTRVSVDSLGAEANNTSEAPSISPEGRYVAFHSSATNLVSGDTNGVRDVFAHDRTTNTTMRVSVASDGAEANNTSEAPSISSDGRYVAFESDAYNLVSGDTGPWWDVFVRGPTWNSSPTDITLSASSVAENQPASTTVGLLTATDPDIADTHIYSFACTVPGADDASFQIGGAGNDELQTAAVFDFETKNAYNICIRADDGHGGTFDKTFAISVTDVNENPAYNLFLPLILR